MVKYLAITYSFRAIVRKCDHRYTRNSYLYSIDTETPVRTLIFKKYSRLCLIKLDYIETETDCSLVDYPVESDAPV